EGDNHHVSWNASDAQSGLDSVLVTIEKNGVVVYSGTVASGDFDFNALGLGTYTINVTATDADADRTDDSLTATATRTVIVSDDDSTPPVITAGASNGPQNRR